MGQIILVRAASTDFDEQDRIVGTLDIPLSIRGQAELAKLAEELKSRPIDVIYASAGKAARESARFLGDELDVKVKVLEELTNLDFGLWQGLEVSEVRRKHPKLFRQWEESPVAICPPNGEMIEQVYERVRRELKPVMKKSHNAVVIVIAPDPLRRVIRCYLKNTELAKVWENSNGSAWETIDVQ